MLHWFKNIQKQRISTFVLVIFILAIAAFLRLYRIADYMTFLGDEGRDVLAVYGILHGDLTLLGPTMSVGGFFLGPIYYYLMTPFLWAFNYSPVGPAVMVALFGVATVFLIYKVGSEFFGKTASVVAALLYSISPLVIAYSRSSWNPNVMAFFTLTTFYSLYKGVTKDNKVLILASGILYGVCLQLHYVELFIAPTIVLFVVLYRILSSANNSFRNYLSKILNDGVLIFSGFVIGWSPFLAFEFRHGFPNTHNIIKFVFSSPDTGGNTNLFPVVWDVFFRLFGRLMTKFPPPEQISVQDSKFTLDLFVFAIHIPISILYFFTVSIAVPSFLYFVYRAFLLFQKKEKSFYWFLLVLLWLVIGIFIFGFYKKSIYDYYFQFMFPLPFLLFGVLFSYLFFQKKIVFKILSGSVLIILILLNISGIPFRFPANRQLSQVEMIARTIYEKSGTEQYNFALAGEGNSDHAYRYFLTLWEKPPIEIGHTGELHADPKTVTNQLLIVCERPPCHPLGEAKWEIAGFGRAEIEGEWDVSVVKVYKLVHYKEKK